MTDKARVGRSNVALPVSAKPTPNPFKRVQGAKVSHPLEGQVVGVLVRATGPAIPTPVRVVTVATDWVLLEPLTDDPGLAPGPRWVPTVHILSLLPVVEESPRPRPDRVPPPGPDRLVRRG